MFNVKPFIKYTYIIFNNNTTQRFIAVYLFNWCFPKLRLNLFHNILYMLRDVLYIELI